MFDLDALRAALQAHGRVARVVIAGAEGSAPREVGAAMLVWADGQSGTIGGGALEFEAAAKARVLLAASPPTPSLPLAGGGGLWRLRLIGTLPGKRLPPPSWGRDGVGGLHASRESPLDQASANAAAGR
jgi:hypothetical protein